MFARSVAQATPAFVERADGIVVLTGGSHRLPEAARLLAEKRGTRLLISGANRVTSRSDLLQKSGISAELFECCVDVGYIAQDTGGNADETMRWVESKGYASLIIVTSSYHMPRSLAELRRTMPDVKLIPYPVVTQGFRKDHWWRDFSTARILFSEYVKFIPTAARLGVARILRTFDGSAFADGTTMRGSSL